MKLKSEVNLNDEVNQTAEASENANLNAQDVTTSDKIEDLHDEQLQKFGKTVRSQTETYRLQEGDHGGNSVFFNLNGKDFRYSLDDGVNGSMYLAYAPDTAMKEVFQNKKGLRESDLDRYVMGIVAIEKDIHVLDVGRLVKGGQLTLNDVTTSTRAVTQKLAKKVHSAGFDGMEFPSNVTGDPCLVVWHNVPDGTGMATTKSQTILSDFKYQDKEAADILVDDLGIPVEP